jgi:2-haloacid dehalogenase
LVLQSATCASSQRTPGTSPALKAGCKAAFVARPGKAFNPKGAKPDVSASDLREVAEQIIEKDT